MTFQAKLALRYLQGRKLITTLTVIAIIFGVMIIVAFNGILPALKEALTGNLSAVADQVDLTVTSETRGSFGIETAEIVAETEGVDLVSPALIRPLGGSNRITDAAMVLLPQPDSPTIPTISPWLTSKPVSWIAVRIPARVWYFISRASTCNSGFIYASDSVGTSP